MTPHAAARELLAAHDDYDRVNAERRAAVDAILASKTQPHERQDLYQRQTEVAKALSLARNRLCPTVAVYERTVGQEGILPNGMILVVNSANNADVHCLTHGHATRTAGSACALRLVLSDTTEPQTNEFEGGY